GSVRSQAILHHRRLPPLEPGEDRGQRHQEAEDHEGGLCDRGDYVEPERTVFHRQPRDPAKRSCTGSCTRPQSASFMNGSLDFASAKTVFASLKSIVAPSLRARCERISQPGSASPAAGTAARTRWTMPRRLVY